jgi:hypothetical protein
MNDLYNVIGSKPSGEEWVVEGGFSYWEDAERWMRPWERFFESEGVILRVEVVTETAEVGG